jgi:hypothetical protein
MSETAPPWKFSVEGEQGSEVDERTGASPDWGGDRSSGEGGATTLHGRRFTVEYKRKIVREADACRTPGAVGVSHTEPLEVHPRNPMQPPDRAFQVYKHVPLGTRFSVRIKSEDPDAVARVRVAAWDTPH